MPRQHLHRCIFYGLVGGVLDVLRDFFVTKTELTCSSAVSVVGTVFYYLFGIYDCLMDLLIYCMIVDFATGVTVAWFASEPQKKISSKRGLLGGCKKIFILLLVGISFKIDTITNTQMIRTVVLWFFIGNEGLSILENVAKLGIPIPKTLKNKLAQLTNEKEGV